MILHFILPFVFCTSGEWTIPIVLLNWQLLSSGNVSEFNLPGSLYLGGFVSAPLSKNTPMIAFSLSVQENLFILNEKTQLEGSDLAVFLFIGTSKYICQVWGSGLRHLGGILRIKVLFIECGKQHLLKAISFNVSKVIYPGEQRSSLTRSKLKENYFF